MKKAMIHIGSGKTGTTSIQNSAAEIEKDGLYPNLTYPLVTKSGHQSLEILFKKYDRISRGLKTKFENGGDYRSFKKDFEHVFDKCLLSAKNIFLSSEFMFEFKAEEVLRLRKYLEDRGFEDFLIVVYLRDPASFYLSYTQQKLKGSSKAYSPFKFKTGYKKHIELWAGVFGKKNIIVREYDKAALHKGSVLKDIETLVNHFFCISVSLPEVSSNRSLTAEGMAILQKFRNDYLKEHENRFAEESDILIKRLSSEKLAGYGSAPRLKKVYENVLRINNSEDIVYLQENFGIFKYLTVSEDDLPDASEYTGSVVDFLVDFDSDVYLDLLFELIYEGVSVGNKS